MKRNIKVEKVSPSAKLPVYGSEGAACFDLHAHINKTVVIPPKSHKVIGTGLKFELEPGYVLFLYSRSGHGFKSNLRFVNCVGVIDSDYRGEVMCGVYNDGDTPYEVKPNERIAQGFVTSYIPCEFEEVSKVSETQRGSGGFGSTGK